MILPNSPIEEAPKVLVLGCDPDKSDVTKADLVFALAFLLSLFPQDMEDGSLGKLGWHNYMTKVVKWARRILNKVRPGDLEEVTTIWG